MKTTKLLLISGLLTFVLVVNRFAESSQASKNESSIFKQIESQMPFPEFVKTEKTIGKVLVKFKIDEKGQIEILEMNYSDHKLKNYVAEKMNQMNLTIPTDAAGKILQVAFSFNVID